MGDGCALCARPLTLAPVRLVVGEPAHQSCVDAAVAAGLVARQASAWSVALVRDVACCLIGLLGVLWQVLGETRPELLLAFLVLVGVPMYAEQAARAET